MGGSGNVLQVHQSVISPGSYGTLPVPEAIAAYSSAANNSSSSNSSNTQSQLPLDSSINSSTSSGFNSNVESSIPSSCSQTSQWGHTRSCGVVSSAAGPPGHAPHLPSHFPAEAQVSIRRGYSY